jgi:hypothetical protein
MEIGYSWNLQASGTGEPTLQHMLVMLAASVRGVDFIVI